MSFKYHCSERLESLLIEALGDSLLCGECSSRNDEFHTKVCSLLPTLLVHPAAFAAYYDEVVSTEGFGAHSVHAFASSVRGAIPPFFVDLPCRATESFCFLMERFLSCRHLWKRDGTRKNRDEDGATSDLVLLHVGVISRLVALLSETTNDSPENDLAPHHPSLTRSWAALVSSILRVFAVAEDHIWPAETLPEVLKLSSWLERHLTVFATHPAAKEAVIALMEDLTRGVQTRKMVSNNIAAFGIHPEASTVTAALFDHTGKLPRAVAQQLFQPMTVQAELQEEAFLICSLLSDAHGFDVACAVLNCVDGFFSVALADLLSRQVTTLAKRIDGARSLWIRGWLATHPTSDQAVVGLDPICGKEIVVPNGFVTPTNASKAWSKSTSQRVVTTAHPQVIPRICTSYRHKVQPTDVRPLVICPKGSKCPYLHVDPSFLREVSLRDCCPRHGGEGILTTNVREDLASISEDHQFEIFCSSSSVKRCCTKLDLSPTAGLTTYLLHEMPIGLPIETEALCRQHRRGQCVKPQHCRYIHICRRIFDQIQVPPEPQPQHRDAPRSSTLPSKHAEVCCEALPPFVPESPPLVESDAAPASPATPSQTLSSSLVAVFGRQSSTPGSDAGFGPTNTHKRTTSTTSSALEQATTKTTASSGGTFRQNQPYNKGVLQAPQQAASQAVTPSPTKQPFATHANGFDYASHASSEAGSSRSGLAYRNVGNVPFTPSRIPPTAGVTLPTVTVGRREGTPSTSDTTLSPPIVASSSRSNSVTSHYTNGGFPFFPQAGDSPARPLPSYSAHVHSNRSSTGSSFASHRDPNGPAAPIDPTGHYQTRIRHAQAAFAALEPQQSPQTEGKKSAMECKYFILGSCTKGDKCTFLHDRNSEAFRRRQALIAQKQRERMSLAQ